MSGLFGGGANITNTEARIGSLRVQQSSQGVPITLLWGRNRLSPNMLWFGDFEAIESRSSTEVGKGGGTTVTEVTYTYRASMVLGLCAGVCTGINSVWRNKDKITAQSRTLATDQLTHRQILPVGKVVTVPNASRWASTVNVYDEVDALVTDFTVLAGVYTFGGSVAVGAVLDITYTIAAVVESLTAMQVAEFQQFSGGALGQAEWPALASDHPTESLAYSGLCFVGATKFLLGPAAGMPQLGFEVDGPRQVGAGNLDANPADILTDLVTSPHYGGASAVALASLEIYRNWCAAAGLWLSPAWSERKALAEYINQICKLTHASPLWSVNQLKIVPLATQALASATGNFSPAPEHASPVAIVNDSHLDAPVEITLSLPADRFNRLSLQYRSRATDYAEAVENAEDKAAVDAYGLIETPSVLQAPEVTTQAVATLIAELLLRDEPANKSQYRFSLPISFSLLEPLDIVQIEDVRSGLAARAVRIVEIDEADDSGRLQVMAEDVATTGAVGTARQATAGFSYGGGPPDATFTRAILPPKLLTNNLQQVWIGVAAGANWGGSTVWVSSTGVDYRRVGDVTVRSRMGALGSSLASASVELNPAQVLDVQLNAVGQLASVSQIDADALRSLVWVNGEVLGYRDAALTAPNRYNLSYLRRKLYGTASPLHSAAEPWMRLDDTLLKLDVAAPDLGNTLYIKVTSRNALGTYVQGLDEVTATAIVLGVATGAPGALTGLALTTPFANTYFDVGWNTASNATDYEVQVLDGGGGLLRTTYTSAISYRYGASDAADDGGARRSYSVKVRARNAGGVGTQATLAIANAAPSTIGGVSASGSGTTRTVSWTGSVATDLAGHSARYSTTPGFSPAAGGGIEFYRGPAATAVLENLLVGVTYYVAVAAFDTWSSQNDLLNWSSSYSFTA